jgi:CheY-like chemotaxis protein
MISEGGRKTAAGGAGRRRVLLVDDNADLCASLAAILELADGEIEIRTAPDGVKAVAVALEWEPEIVFVDIHMPRMNGFQVARRLRERFLPGSMKLILMSGVTIDETLERDAKQAGFDACIDKAAEPDLWLRHLEAALAG